MIFTIFVVENMKTVFTKESYTTGNKYQKVYVDWKN